MITNDTLMRDATFRETVAAKIYAEDPDMCVDGAVNETDKLIARLNETTIPAEAAIANAVKFSGVMESCDISGREKTLRFRSRDCVYRIVFFDGDVADGLELGRSYFVEAEIMQTNGGTPFLKATAPPRALP